jgi:hypothetical protein
MEIGVPYPCGNGKASLLINTSKKEIYHEEASRDYFDGIGFDVV